MLNYFYELAGLELKLQVKYKHVMKANLHVQYNINTLN